MIEVAGIDHVVLRTSDMEAMLHFYQNVLGLTVERKTAREFGLIQLRAGTALIDLVAVDSKLGKMGGGPPSSTGNNMDHFCLQIKPVDEQALSSYLRDKGIEPGEFSRRYGAQGYGNSMYISDPEGNTVELRNQQ
jgi:glyoxylase I family protein